MEIDKKKYEEYVKQVTPTPVSYTHLDVYKRQVLEQKT